MEPMTRRQALSIMSASGAALCLDRTGSAWGQPPHTPSCLGIVIYALGIHQRYQWAGRHQGLAPAVAFLEECRQLGGGGIQYPFAVNGVEEAREVRRRADGYGLHVEAIVSPPGDAANVERFERAVRVAQEAGATVARTVILPGRRYERFQSLAEFREFEARGLKSLELAEPILARHKFRLAVENHKDQRVAEKLDTLRQLSSEFIGLCVDVGNNFPLFEDPLETVQAFAPWAFTVHLKDQAVRSCDEGLLLADVALGDGILDLPRIVKVLRDAQPDIKFNFETITRDSIKVPFLTDRFWSTLADTPASAVARTLRILKTRSYPEPFASISQLPAEEQLAAERNNVQKSLAYAKAYLE